MLLAYLRTMPPGSHLIHEMISTTPPPIPLTGLRREPYIPKLSLMQQEETQLKNPPIVVT